MSKKRKYEKILALSVMIIGTVACAALAWFRLVISPQVNIVYMVNSGYVPYMMVSLESAIANKNKSSRYDIHILAEDFTALDSENIRKMSGNKVNITIYPTRKLALDKSRLGRFSSFGITLQKLFIADYLPGVKKVLYLDADTLVQSDLTELYKTKLDGDYAAAVKDGLMYQFPEHVAAINPQHKDFYFNSGIMLLNLEKIRSDDIMRRTVIYFNTHNEIFGDQDVLNVVFGGKVKPLSYRYNCNSTFFEEKDAAFLSAFYGESVPQTTREVYDRAAILHFAGHKPWTSWFSHSYLKPLWQQYAAQVAAKYKISF